MPSADDSGAHALTVDSALTLTVDDFFRLRRHCAWPGRATWRPFVCAVLPCYSMGAMLVLQPVFFDEIMTEEWLSERDKRHLFRL